MAAGWAWWRQRRARRNWRWQLVIDVLILVAVGSGVLDFAGGLHPTLDALRTRDLSRLHVDWLSLLTWLAALPWGPLLPILLYTGYAALRRGVPPAWWGLWIFAVLANLRYLTTGYAFGGAIAPGLAVLIWLWHPTRDDQAIADRVLWPKRGVGLALMIATAANLLAQAAGGNLYFNAPRAWVETAIGPVALPVVYAQDAAAIQTVLRDTVPPDRPILALNWGAAWYLIADRPNPTLFDITFPGLGTTGSEAAAVRTALERDPPLAVVGIPRTLQAVVTGVTPNQGAIGWWASAASQYEDRTPPDASYWTVWTRR